MDCHNQQRHHQHQHHHHHRHETTHVDVTDDVKDIIENLKRLESTTYKRRVAPATVTPNRDDDDHMMIDGSDDSDDDTSNSASSSSNSNDMFRNVILQWMYNVADIFDVNHRVVAVATWYLDEAVRRSSIKGINVQSPTDYQLISLTAFYMSMKLYGNRLFPLVELVKLGRGQFTVDDIANMELKLIQTFEWHLTPPTYVCYLQEFEKLFPSSGANVQETGYTSTAAGTTKTQSKPSLLAKDLLIQHAQKLVYNAMFRPVPVHATTSQPTLQDLPPSMIASAAMLLSLEKHGRSLLTSSQYDVVVRRLQKVVNMKMDEIAVLEDAIRLLDPSMAEDEVSNGRRRRTSHAQQKQRPTVSEQRREHYSVVEEERQDYESSRKRPSSKQQGGASTTMGNSNAPKRDDTNASSSPTSVVGTTTTSASPRDVSIH